MFKSSLWKETKIFAYCLVAAGLGATFGSHSWAAKPPIVDSTIAAAATAPITAGDLSAGFAPIVEKSLPAVVNISTSKKARPAAAEAPSEMDPFFRQFFGREFGGRGFSMPRERSERSLGSGVIVRSDGYLLTNHHVIDGASDINVVLHDKRELKARLIGSDPKTDIAVLKVDAIGLPVVPMADSTKIRVGDLVLAMGNPFGLGQTVTMGIVSAQGRTNLGIEDYEDFIQTDAAINPGNSGGALLNARGELIGINTAILGASGGNQGVGFAVPVDLARNVMTQVIDHGKVVRGYLGVAPQNITPALAKTFQLKDTHGVLIGDVTPGAPAQNAGLERGDVIVALKGKSILNSNQLRMTVSMMAPGSEVNLRVLHGGVEKNVSLKLAELPTDVAQAGGGRSKESSAPTSALQGVSVEASSGRGVVVTDVDAGSAAAAAGLREGDVIQEVNRTPVTNLADFNRALQRVNEGNVLLLINRGGSTQYMAIQNK